MKKFLSIRSLAFSLLGILLMSGLAGFHDNACPNGTFMIGNHLPGGAMTYLFFVAVVWNGLAGRLSRRLVLAPGELVLVLSATLIACFPPTSGLFRFLPRVIALPWYYLPGRPEWAQHRLLADLSPGLFPAPWLGNGVPAPGTPENVLYQRVYLGFFSGLSSGARGIAFSDIPFAAWIGPLLRWGPLVLFLAIACLSLQFVVHRQWSLHEQLSYPLAQVTGSFCRRADGLPGVPDLFRDGLFWWGFTPVFLLYLVEFLGTRYPQTLPTATFILPNLRHWWVPVTKLIPAIQPVRSAWSLCQQSLFFTIVGAAYFVSSEIGLSMGLSSIGVVLAGFLYLRATGEPINGPQMDIYRAGTYLGYAIMLLYMGRAYFRSVFARALGLRRAPPDASDDAAVLAARVLLISFAAFAANLWVMGMDLAIAVFYALAALMLFLVFSRVICETGIPFLQPCWFPPRMLTDLLGPAVIGPRSITLTHWVNAALLEDPRECLMPYVATSAKVAEGAGLSLRRLYAFLVGALLVALAVACVATFYTHYNIGSLADSDASRGVINHAFGDSARYIRTLKDIGLYDAASSGSALTRLGLLRADPRMVGFFLAGAGLVAASALLRFKFPRFPIHPVLFIVWGTYSAERCWGSFLVGWFAKALVLSFGGGRSYQRLKPLFIGLIAGELLFIGSQVLGDLLHVWIFGAPPSVSLQILPG